MSFCPLPAEMMTAFELHQEIKTFPSIFTRPRANFQVRLVHFLVGTICFNSVLKPGCVKIERVGQVLEFLKIISMRSHSTWTIEIFEIYETIMWGVQSRVWNLCEGIQLWDMKQLWQSSVWNLWNNCDNHHQCEIFFAGVQPGRPAAAGGEGDRGGSLVWQHRRDHWDQRQVPLNWLLLGGRWGHWASLGFSFGFHWVNHDWDDWDRFLESVQQQVSEERPANRQLVCIMMMMMMMIIGMMIL